MAAIRRAIHAFVADLTDDAVLRIFRDYDRGGYDHLVRLPRKPTTLAQKRDALRQYLAHHIIFRSHERDEDGELPELPETLGKIVRRRDVSGLLDVMGDQFFQEPLIHTLNQGAADFWFP